MMTMSKKYGISKVHLGRVRHICRILEEDCCIRNEEQYNMCFDALVAMAKSSIGLPTNTAIEDIIKYVRDDYPRLDISDIIENAAKIITGKIDIIADKSIETEAAIESMVEYITCNTGYSFYEVLEMIQKETT